MNSPSSTVSTLEKPTRYRFGVLGFACALSMITYLDRVCFGSVADNIQAEFQLDLVQRGMLFTAFALAYAVFEVPTGWLGDVFGPKKTLIRIVLWWSLFTALTGLIWPVAGYLTLGFYALVTIRFLFGMGEAGAYPNIARAFHNWFPFQERGSAKGAVWMAGRFMGGMTPIVVFGLLNLLGPTNWRPMLWIFGGMGVAWCVVFWWWFKDRPEQMPGVNAAELALIRGDNHVPATASARVPWGRLLGSGNLWILCAMYFCASYGWYFNITYLPGFLRENGIDPKVDVGGALLAGAPLLLGSVACLLGGLMTDAFIRRTGNRKWGRRLFGMVGHGMCGLCYLSSLLTGGDMYLFIFAIAFAAFWNDITMGAAWASCLDIGGRYSGIVAGCMNTIGNLGGAVAGMTTGLVLQYMTEGYAKDDPQYAELIRQGWQINIVSFAGVYFIAVFCWMGFDSTKPLVDRD